MAPWVIAAALAMQKVQEQKQKRDARKQARGEAQSERAASLGYPTSYGAGMQANQIDQIEGPNYLGMLMDAEEKKKQRGDKGELGGNDYLRAFMG